MRIRVPLDMGARLYVTDIHRASPYFSRGVGVTRQGGERVFHEMTRRTTKKDPIRCDGFGGGYWDLGGPRRRPR